MKRFSLFFSFASWRYHPFSFLKILILLLLSFRALIILIVFTLGVRFVTIGIRSCVFLRGSCLPVNLDWTLKRDKERRRKIVLRCIQCSGDLRTKLKAVSFSERGVSIILTLFKHHLLYKDIIISYLTLKLLFWNKFMCRRVKKKRFKNKKDSNKIVKNNHKQILSHL